MSVSTKVALITGAATGLGKRTAIEIAKQGINVCLNFYKSDTRAIELAQYIAEKYGVQAIALQADISDFEECAHMVEEAIRLFGRIDILINNAGPYVFERKALTEYQNHEWEYIINGNLNSAFYLCKLIVPFMRENHWGRIINFGFERAETAPGWLYRSAFAAAKVGLVSLTKTLAMEEAEHGITINMICPGEIVGKWKEANIVDARSSTTDRAPIGRAGSGEDIARVISFLCNENSDFITGSIVAVTGGKNVLAKRMNEND